MGVIAAIIVGLDDRSESDVSATVSERSGPYLSQDLTTTGDPFMTRFNLDNVRVDERTLRYGLGLLIVISNLLGD